MIKKEDLIDAVIARENDTVLEVSRILRDTARRHLIVLDENDAPVGLISTVDINNRVVSEELDVNKTTAKDIMTKPIDTVAIDDSFEDAYKMMVDIGTYSMPVTLHGKLIGLLELNKTFEKLTEKAKEECKGDNNGA